MTISGVGGANGWPPHQASNPEDVLPPHPRQGTTGESPPIEAPDPINAFAKALGVDPEELLSQLANGDTSTLNPPNPWAAAGSERPTSGLLVDRRA